MNKISATPCRDQEVRQRVLRRSRPISQHARLPGGALAGDLAVFLSCPTPFPFHFFKRTPHCDRSEHRIAFALRNVRGVCDSSASARSSGIDGLLPATNGQLRMGGEGRLLVPAKRAGLARLSPGVRLLLSLRLLLNDG